MLIEYNSSTYIKNQFRRVFFQITLILSHFCFLQIFQCNNKAGLLGSNVIYQIITWLTLFSISNNVNKYLYITMYIVIFLMFNITPFENQRLDYSLLSFCELKKPRSNSRKPVIINTFWYKLMKLIPETLKISQRL